MAGLVPAIHVLVCQQPKKDVDARVKPGHDEEIKRINLLPTKVS
jgi:hypothetical protein